MSSASIWEIGIKVNLKKLTVDMTQLLSAIDENGFLELPISAKHAAAVSKLKNIHRDPFDRILLAQTMSEPLKFLTSDKMLQKYSDLVEGV